MIIFESLFATFVASIVFGGSLENTKKLDLAYNQITKGKSKQVKLTQTSKSQLRYLSLKKEYNNPITLKVAKFD